MKGKCFALRKPLGPSALDFPGPYRIGLGGIKIQIDQARVGCTELLKHLLKRSKQAMQVPHDFGFMWFRAKSVVKGWVGS